MARPFFSNRKTLEGPFAFLARLTLTLLFLTAGFSFRKKMRSDATDRG